MAVRDDGAGIEPDDRSRIFERFYRLTDHERVTGTGLGLPIARELARAMGGDLDVASLPEVGSSFVLVMPGPVGADPAVIADTLRQALAATLSDSTTERCVGPGRRPPPRPPATGMSSDTVGRPTRVAGPPYPPAPLADLRSAPRLSTSLEPDTEFVDKPVDAVPAAHTVRHPHCSNGRVTRPTRGSGKPGCEPDGSRKTEPALMVRDDVTPGAAPRTAGTRAHGGVP